MYECRSCRLNTEVAGLSIISMYIFQKLQIRVKEMEQLRRSNSHQSAVAGVVGLLAVNPEPSSLSVSMTSVETGGEEGDAEQAWAKYREMKVSRDTPACPSDNRRHIPCCFIKLFSSLYMCLSPLKLCPQKEYVTMKDHYKKLKSSYDKVNLP